ncbi:MAG: hypothetical protein IJT91_02870 [Clostridia bacterium]|nr:hypothetical protein [Clostridia bacterium]
MDLIKNPTVFLTVWKIFAVILIVIFSIMTIHDAISFKDSLQRQLLNDLKFFAYFFIGMTVLVALGCLLYPVIYGGRYCVIFEMDEKGVNHKQMPKQAKRAELVALLTVLAGIASGNVVTAGIGLASARTEMYSDFSKVRKIISRPRRRLINLNSFPDHNQVYASKEDFDFVLRYILANAPDAKFRGKRPEDHTAGDR